MCKYKQIIFYINSENNYFCNCIINIFDLYNFTEENLYDGITFFLQKFVTFILEKDYFEIDIKMILNTDQLLPNNYDLIINLKENIITYLDFKFIGYYEDFCQLYDIYDFNKPEYNLSELNMNDEILDSIHRYEKIRKIISFVKKNKFNKDLIKDLNIKLATQKCRLFRFQNYTKFKSNIYCNKIYINVDDDFIDKQINITDINSNIIGTFTLHSENNESKLYYDTIDIELFEILNEIIEWSFFII